MGTIEERPGIPPDRNMFDKSSTWSNSKISLILVDNFYDPSLPNNIARQTGAAVVILPNQVEDPAVKTYFD
jgi:hypothetical protein